MLGACQTRRTSADTVNPAFRYGVKIKHRRARSGGFRCILGFKATYKGTPPGEG